MKVLLSWLKDYVDIELSAQEVAEILSNLGFPYEGIEQLDNDAVIDVEVTSNRGDCLGLYRYCARACRGDGQGTENTESRAGGIIEAGIGICER